VIGACRNGDWGLGPAIIERRDSLALDDRGFAGALVKGYGGRARTGFVYPGIEDWNTEMLYCLDMVTEYRPR
jgi:hypothetical protein